ncbi:MAG: VTT domain-containing protein [Planctomycetes bacterium]|nr:VTT domain-containing protein [Planctomycetota bacterium]
MSALLEFLTANGYVVVFAWVLIGQIGVPVPAGPLLLAAGALAGGGQLSLGVLLLLSVVASLLADAAWFWLGRRHGARVLSLLCRISLEPDSCVRRTQLTFATRGASTLLFGKFVPGLGLLGPPLAGMSRMGVVRFVTYSVGGALLWAGAFLVPGYLLHQQLEVIAERLALTGAWLLTAFAVVVVGWIAWRWSLRRRFLRRLRTARIAPLELHRRIADGEAVFVVDLRHDTDVGFDPFVVPGALRMTAELLEQRHLEIPRDRDVVLYCS